MGAGNIGGHDRTDKSALGCDPVHQLTLLKLLK
jgi:hypothetical protein